MTYNLTGFNGQRRDPVSGYSHSGNGYRAYNPVLMRFNCPDDMSPFGPGGINPYAFCAGDPVNRADPSGHFSLGQGIGMALGLVAGFALSVLTEGAAMPAVLTLMATVAGDAAIGAGAELATEAIDGQRINWGQVGISAGLSAVTTLAGFGMGRLTQLKGTSNRPFGGLMVQSPEESGYKTATSTVMEENPMSAQWLPLTEKHSLIDTTLEHTEDDSDPFWIISESKGYYSGHSRFINLEAEYKPDVWVFRDAERGKNAAFYINELTEYQFQRISQKNGFYGVMPKKMISDNVVNPATLEATRGLRGKQLEEAFLKKTPVGKLVKRRVDYFGLNVARIEREDIPHKEAATFTTYFD